MPRQADRHTHAAGEPGDHPHPRTARLRAIVEAQCWTLSDLARAMGRRERTARAWRDGSRVIPEHTLEALELRLQVAAMDSQGAAT